MSCHRLRTERLQRGNERDKTRAEERRYKDVRPASLDVRQRGTPGLGFPFAEDVPLFRGNLFRACRSVRSELRGLGRTDGGPEAESGYARCQILRAMPPSLSSFVTTTTAGAVFHFVVFFCCNRAALFYFCFFFLLFSLSPSVSALSAVQQSFNRKLYGSLVSASASANASAQLILWGRAKGGILAWSQMFPSRAGRAKRAPE